MTQAAVSELDKRVPGRCCTVHRSAPGLGSTTVRISCSRPACAPALRHDPIAALSTGPEQGGRLGHTSLAAPLTASLLDWGEHIVWDTGHWNAWRANPRIAAVCRSTA